MNWTHNTPNKLARTRVYLGGNMENSSNTAQWREEISVSLRDMGIVPLDPMKSLFIEQPEETDEDRLKLVKQRESGAFNEVRDYMRGVVKKDLRCIDLSDFVIFNIEIDKPTFGTIHELVVATEQKKPVFVVVQDLLKIPLWIVGLLPRRCFFNSLGEVLAHLHDLDCGKIEMDMSIWRLLHPHFR